MVYPRVSSLKTSAQFRQRLAELMLDLPLDEVLETGSAAVLAQPVRSRAGIAGNRFCILPMEGWDGTADGRPTDLTRRRWKNFGLSGAKLIWGGEAVAVRHDGRANPHQLLLNDTGLSELNDLRELLVETHQQAFGRTDDLLIGLQLTHSGRYSKPNSKTLMEPRTAYRHPVLDARLNINDDGCLLSDDDLKRLTDDFIAACVLAQKAGFSWVDVKHCHGYLGHELLSGFNRPGLYGGSFENRTRFLREIVSGIRTAAPGLQIGVRLSVFDYVPFQPGNDAERTGIPAVNGPYACAFGGDGSGLGIDLTEPLRFLELLRKLEIDLLCTSCGSPYYNPHIQRPALFPPSDGYQPPEDPLVGVCRQIQVTADIKRQCPEMIVVGSGYSYLQEWLPHVGQALVRLGMVDSVGLGRMVLSYPDLPADVLSGRELARRRICRTFSDCTTAPRNGLVSGCFPLDPFYKAMPEREQLQAIRDSFRKT
jgi:NADPH2 dehydrogenase